MKKAFVAIIISLAILNGNLIFAQPKEGEPGGGWKAFDQGQYTIAKDVDTVMVVSTWDELTASADQVIDWRRTPKKEIPPIIEKLMKKLVDLPGIINVIVSKHRVEIYRANIYGWDNVKKDILAAFATSELKKTPAPAPAAAPTEPKKGK
jgi:hypothetical protein